MEHGFFRSLFDISFTSFIATKIIKFVYVVTLVMVGLAVVVGVIVAFRVDTGWGVGALIFGPLGALIYIVVTRLWLEFIIQVFRITELLRDQSGLQRAAFSQAGWLSATPPAVPAQCPECGEATTPGAAFCRHCGHRLV